MMPTESVFAASVTLCSSSATSESGVSAIASCSRGGEGGHHCEEGCTMQQGCVQSREQGCAWLKAAAVLRERQGHAGGEVRTHLQLGLRALLELLHLSVRRQRHRHCSVRAGDRRVRQGTCGYHGRLGQSARFSQHLRGEAAYGRRPGPSGPGCRSNTGTCRLAARRWS